MRDFKVQIDILEDSFYNKSIVPAPWGLIVEQEHSECFVIGGKTLNKSGILTDFLPLSAYRVLQEEGLPSSIFIGLDPRSALHNFSHDLITYKERKIEHFISQNFSILAKGNTAFAQKLLRED